MAQRDSDQKADTTSIFTSGLVRGGGGEVAPSDAAAETDAEAPLAGVEGLPEGSALLVVKRGPNAGSRYHLQSEVVTAGRHPDSDIFLDDVSVSRRHAEFRRTEDGFAVVDVGSLNGTYVNREPIETSSLSGGDEVQIGKFRLVYLTSGAMGAAGTHAHPGGDAAASA